jgi:hypothetical protein
VTADGNTVEASEGKPVNVALTKTAKQVQVYVTASDLKMATAASKIQNLRYTRQSGALVVGFDVDDSFAGAQVAAQLVDLNGKVQSSYRGKSAAGANSFALKAAKPGLYVLHVGVGGQQASRKVLVP